MRKSGFQQFFAVGKSKGLFMRSIGMIYWEKEAKEENTLSKLDLDGQMDLHFIIYKNMQTNCQLRFALDTNITFLLII